MHYTATYSPDDNKLRLYASGRLSPELYARVKAAGFRWAPKQDLFVAPMWTPDREDLLTELCGEIDDEDTSLVERAEDRAERFEEYSERRLSDAESARKAVSAIADNIPLGQPVLIGHHSEKHARKDAERIENGMRKAVKLWETSQYWERRAAGALRHAKYKERPDVRARRIKGLEADARKQERIKADAQEIAHKWALVDQPEKWKEKSEGTKPTREERAQYIAGRFSFPVTRENADGSPCDHVTGWGAWDVLRPEGERYSRCPAKTVDEVLAALGPYVEGVCAWADRWLTHYRNRLAYERALLAEHGGLVAERHNIEVGGQVLTRWGWGLVLKINKSNGVVSSVTITAEHFYRNRTTASIEEIKDYRAPTAEEAAKVKAATKQPPLCNYPKDGALHITKAQYDQVRSGEAKGTTTVKATDTAGTHRVRSLANYIARGLGATVPDQWGHTVVYLTDVPRKDPPKPEAPAELPVVAPEPRPVRAYKAPEPTAFDAMRDQLKQGVKVVTAPQLFPTPPDIAVRMVELAELEDGQRILEPSAGTGNLVWEIARTVSVEACTVHAVELHGALAGELQAAFQDVTVHADDFLSFAPDAFVPFDRIIMNPPFDHGADIKHIRHARSMLKPGGRLVALCAAGPRQREAFEDDAELWEDLPAGSFAAQGTNVHVALVVLTA